MPDAFSSGQRFFTDASRNLLTGLCLLAITDDGLPDGARNLSTVLALLEPRDGKSAVKSLEELAADLPAGNPARQFLLVASVERRRRRNPRLHRAQPLMSLLRRRRQPHALGRRVDLASRSEGKPTILYIASATDRGDRGALRLVHLLAGAVGAARTPRACQAAGCRRNTARHRRGSGITRSPPPPATSPGPEHRAASSSCSRTPICLRRGAATPGRSRTRCWRCSARSSSRLESVGEAEEIGKRLGDYSVRTTGQSSTKGTQSSSSGKSFSVARRPLIAPSELMAWSARENGVLVIDAEGTDGLANRDITRKRSWGRCWV